MVTAIKICGITNQEDALKAASLGVNALGFVFAPSPRQVKPQEAKKIIQLLPPFLSKVGVFFNQPYGEVAEIIRYCGLDTVQLHGEESPEYCEALPVPVIKGFRVGKRESLNSLPDYKVAAFLLDTYSKEQAGGTGRTFDWNLAKEVKQYGPVILAGGLNPENINLAIQEVQPYGIDVSSGIELRPGKKDPLKLVKLVEKIRRQENEFTR